VRERAYAHLAPIADRWNEALGVASRFPPMYAAFIAHCAARGQTRPTPLLLTYGQGDYNRLHQDTYGEVAFPFQLTFFLSEPGVDYAGGEFVLVENRPRMQSAAQVIVPHRGDVVIFPNSRRPIAPRHPRRHFPRRAVTDAPRSRVGS
jgi:uncharacterized protein